MFFSKQDEIALRQLLKKAKAQADAQQAAQSAALSSSSQAAREASPGLQGGYGGDTASYQMAEPPLAEAAQCELKPPQPQAEHKKAQQQPGAAEPTELAALRRILTKYDVAPRDVDALLAWRHSAEF